MKGTWSLILLLILFSCSKEEPLLAPLSSSDISGDRLWERLSTESDYRNYRQWSGHEGRRPGQSPHGVIHEVYANKILYDALPADKAPDGSILVKENYNSTGDLLKLTVMTKVKDYDPDNGDWFWAVYDTDGTVLTEGSPAGCIGCHQGLKSNDYIIIKDLSTAP